MPKGGGKSLSPASQMSYSGENHDPTHMSSSCRTSTHQFDSLCDEKCLCAFKICIHAWTADQHMISAPYARPPNALSFRCSNTLVLREYCDVAKIVFGADHPVQMSESTFMSFILFLRFAKPKSNSKTSGNLRVLQKSARQDTKRATEGSYTKRGPVDLSATSNRNI